MAKLVVALFERSSHVHGCTLSIQYLVQGQYSSFVGMYNEALLALEMGFQMILQVARELVDSWPFPGREIMQTFVCELGVIFKLKPHVWSSHAPVRVF